MSELADKDRKIKRGWAKPNSSHDRLIRLLKYALPAMVGLVLAFLALVPLENRKEASFLVDKNKLDQAEERMKVEAAQYRGQDEEGRPFVLDARSAVQATSKDPVVDIRTMSARLQLDEGPAEITADQARFNPDENMVAVLGPVMVAIADGYRLMTSNVAVDLRDRSLQSQGEVQGRMPIGTFRADRMSADLPERKVVLEGNARLHIEQGALTKGQ
ncbi:MAG TPA: LPS export ABC transporter periplasmic protein LptC [Allosphingosinicella sp.]|jgi:lipopolysaccharide export system protein LptC|nr:LPS export ABC transporter periplasmic protein LptC [Allosphingosinicella sp.]